MQSYGFYYFTFCKYSNFIKEIERGERGYEMSETEKKFETLIFDEGRIRDVFMGKDGVKYIEILADDNVHFIRKREQVKKVEGLEGKMKFMLPIDYKMKLIESVKFEDGYKDIDHEVEVSELKELLAKEEVKAFVSFIVPKEWVGETKTNEEGHGYNFIKIPGVGSFARSTEQIREVKNNKDSVRFVIPSGSRLQTSYSKRVEGVPDTAPNMEKWTTVKRILSGFEIKDKMVEHKKRQKEQEYEAPSFCRHGKSR